MRLKEIKPGMAIYCKNLDELKALLAEAHRLGYCWADGTLANNACCPGNATIKFHPEGSIRKYKHITWGEEKEGTEFSDLILPELTAEEVLKIVDDICETKSYNEKNCSPNCPFCHGIFCRQWMAEHPTETVEICAKWKSDHEKKEPEIETVDICRIIKIQPEGKKRCVYEEDIKKPITLEVEETLKRYCMEHEGEFIAVHEVVSRVKK